MDSEIINVAYIDAANVHKCLKDLGWKLDYKKFRIWLKNKHNIKVVYIFTGYIADNIKFYKRLQAYGFTLIFKEITYDGTGNIKGNCDTDLVLKVVQDTYEDNFNQAVIVSSDGDYVSLLRFLLAREKLLRLVSPAEAKKCSLLIKRTDAKIEYINDNRNKLEYVK